MKREATILPILEDYVTLPYPKPLFFGQGEGEYQAPFLGYNFISGRFPIGLNDEQRASSTLLLASFLKELHAFPVDKAIEKGVPFDSRNLLDLPSRKKKMFLFLETISPGLDKEEFALLKAYLKELKTAPIHRKDVFLHGDLHFKNILVDKHAHISGVIDWGDMNIGHPACDLSIAFSFLPVTEREKFFHVYGEVDEETFLLARFLAVFIPTLILMQAFEDQEERIVAEAKEAIFRALQD
ncbi:aminoglycoside phosphotransferase (APT) family kinase protein [Thalassobacillus pellis]|nr:aminoglycoside phosphotransferase (APT) family kinase protein [Thalassobacillus pellis]